MQAGEPRLPQLAPVNLSTVPDAHHEDDKDFILNGVDDTIVADADSIKIVVPRQLLNALRTRIGSQCSDARQKAGLEWCRQAPYLTISMWRQLDPAGHRSSLDPEIRNQLLQRDGALFRGLCQGDPRLLDIQSVLQFLQQAYILNGNNGNQRLTLSRQDHPLSAIHGTINDLRKLLRDLNG